MAVTLLVLLAVMGLAFISSARTERVISAGATHAAQGEMLVRAALGLVESVLVNDVITEVNGQRKLRPSSRDGQDVLYRHWDSATGDDADTYLAERVPTRLDGGRVVWPAISGFLDTVADTFEDPTRPYGAHAFNERTELAPSTIQYGGRTWPALQVGSGAEAQRYLAADTDSDGIADAALFPLGIQNGGVTYYAALRIVDNNSALNASVAWRRHDQLDPNRRVPGTSFFPTHVDLASLLNPAEVDNLTRYRLAGLTPQQRQGMAPTDAWIDGARRIHDPSSPAAFRLLPASDALALAQDPLGLLTSASVDPFLASLLPSSLRTKAHGRYAAGDVDRWYEDNYNFDNPGVSRRSLMVASNPVTNVTVTRQVPPRLAKLFGVPETVAATPTNLNAASFELLWYGYWSMMSGEEKWTPFDLHLKEAGKPDAEKIAGKELALDDVPLPAMPIDPYELSHPQRMFRSPLRPPMSQTDGSGKPPVIASASADTLRMPQFEVLLLRAALAAVNTIDLRDEDHDVTAKRITLNAIVGGGDKPVSVTVFGNEPQPFITEVYAHTNTQAPGGPNRQRNPNGYVAVELHNPFDEPLSLKHWRLGAISRTRAASAGRVSIAPISGMAGFDDSVIIPRNGYLILENYRDDNAGTAKFRPTSSGLPATGVVTAGPHVATAYVANLHEVLADGGSPGGELVLLRPRDATEGPKKGVDYDETRSLDDWVPIDQYDFSGIELQDPGEEKYVIVHYARESGLGARAWKFVYPGRYDGRKARERQEGTYTWEIGHIDSDLIMLVANLGRADAGVRQENKFPGIPLAQQPSPTDAYPYGQFARTSDALEVPFIGAYRVASGSTLLEMNGITMDAAFADDLDSATDKYEHIGKFVPIPPIGEASPGSPKTPRQPIKWKPNRSVGHGAEVRFENFHIANIVDSDAVQIQGYDDRAKSGNWYAPGHIILRNFEVGYTERSPAGAAKALHVDHIQITLGQEYQEIKTDVTIDTGFIHSGNADTLLIQDGKYGTIHIRNLEVGPGLPSVKITIEKGGSVDRVIIENCPKLLVSVTGEKGKESEGGNIGYVEVINSPGAKIKPQNKLKLDIRNSSGGTPVAGGVNDYSDELEEWRYGWARDFVDHFTTVPSAADEFEDVNGVRRVKEQTQPAAAAPLEGLININTAPWPVLAALPLFEAPVPGEPKKTTDTRARAIITLARSIVSNRASAPYGNVQDFKKGVDAEYRALAAQEHLKDPMPQFDFDPTDPAAQLDIKRASDALREWKQRQGDLSPNDGMIDEVSQRSLLVDRIGNLVTTRSDSFTCYITIQGWRNAARQGGDPELVLERKDVYVLNRSQVTPANPRVKIMSSRMH